ncbi:MAG: L-methionine/branched-chain amino acid transporter [Shewanella sp.]
MSHKLGRLQGAAMMATTLLGTGVFILPQMTLALAGSNAVIAWLVLTLAILPVAWVFGRLAATFSHAAGPAYFTELAFGAVLGRVIGLMFLLVVPIGAPAALLMTYEFIELFWHFTGAWPLLIQLSMLALLWWVNRGGIQVSAKLQLGLTLLIVAVVVALIAGGSREISQLSMAVVSKIEVNAVMAAMAIGLWSFLGIEAVTHLSDDFIDPKRDMLAAIIIGTSLVGVIYLLCTCLLLWFLMSHATNSAEAMVMLFNHFFGAGGTVIIGVLGVASGLATVNVYSAGCARLMASFAEQGLLPEALCHKNAKGVPINALSLLLIAMAVILVIAEFYGASLETLISWSNGVFVLIYSLCMLAAAKLLKDKGIYWVVAFSAAFCGLLAWSIGAGMLYGGLIFSGCAMLLWTQRRVRAVKLNSRI